MSLLLLARSLGSVVAALAFAGPQTVPALAPADPPQVEGEARVDPDLKEEGLLRERIQLDEPRAAELRVRFAKVARQLRGNVIRLTIERGSGERPAGGRGGFEPQVTTVEVSGFVLDPAGHVVTFANALEQAERVSVRFVNLQGVRPRRARIIGTDSETDVGVLDVGPIALPAMPFGAPNGPPANGGATPEARIVVSMSGVRGGESAVALGVLDGGLAPPVGGRMFQISVARRPETFGGIVARCDGQVVAMLYAPAFGGVPEGRMQPMLAVPTGQIQSGVARVLERATPASAERKADAPTVVAAVSKPAPRAWMGLGASDLAEPEFLRQIDAPGAIVVDEVFEASPALAAGIVPHDVLLQWNGRALRNVDDLSNLLAASPPGAKVVLSCLRGLARRDVEVTLGAW